MALVIATWCWGEKYDLQYVERWASAVRRNLKQPARLIVNTDRTIPDIDVETLPIWDAELCELRGCFARLRMFDPEWQLECGINWGDRIVCLDLDNVITGPLGSLFDIDDPFAILQGANAANPCPYNGSVWMLRAGHRPDVWHDFTPQAAAKIPFHSFPDDQGWMHHKMPGAKSWKVGASGIYGFKKPGWPKGEGLPANASIVAFFGQRDPSHYTALGWVKQHWQ